jgi:hypothetical protein
MPELLDIDALGLEERLQLEIEAINDHGFHPNGKPYLSFWQAAKEFRVPKTTLNDCFRGVPDRKEAHASQRKLSVAHEEVLVAWIKEMGRRGIPLQMQAVKEWASIIAGVEIGDSWVSRFRERHPELRAQWTTGLEKC